MDISIIIPVWNGESVILHCLEALYKHTQHLPDRPNLLEVICVDNASQDRSRALIQEHYPQVHLLSQKVNLGFAGGVNVGLKAAQGSIAILLNQDCLIESPILESICDGFEKFPEAGIVGCTIFHDDGTINHAGAVLQYPLAYGQHLTEASDDMPHYVDYVTGALFAIRRQTWEKIGLFDEGFYPRDHEEVDYCYRARAHGLEILYVPDAHGRHLFSSHEWQVEPVRYTANQHQSRYRYIIKHFSPEQLTEFFAAEQVEIQKTSHTEQLTGRVLAARHTLRNLDEIVQSRYRDLQQTISDSVRRKISVGYTAILRGALARAKEITNAWTEKNPPEFTPLPPLSRLNLPDMTLPSPPTPPSLPPLPLPPSLSSENFPKPDFAKLQQLEHTLLKQIFMQPNPDENKLRWILSKIWHMGLRLLSFLSGREHRLLASLNTIHVWRLDQLEKHYVKHLQHNQSTSNSYIEHQEVVIEHQEIMIDHQKAMIEHQEAMIEYQQTLIERQEAYWQDYLKQYNEHIRYLEKHDALLQDEISQNRYRQAQFVDQLQILDVLTDYDYR